MKLTKQHFARTGHCLYEHGPFRLRREVDEAGHWTGAWTARARVEAEEYGTVMLYIGQFQSAADAIEACDKWLVEGTPL